MKAIGFKKSLKIDDPNSFIAFETEKPSPKGRDLLVKISAVSVNPVDFKIRQGSLKDKEAEQPKVIGWDAVGEVVEVGDDVSLFEVGDQVYYAGDITKPGCNSEYQLIDERIVGSKPKKIEIEKAAAMPLTTLTAWEILFDRMRLSAEKDKGKSILIIGGAGGVGSIAIQLAKKILGLKVIATASRPETIKWCKDMGADHVVNHRSLVASVKEAGFDEVDFILDFVDINSYWDDIVELVKTQGHVASITGSAEPIALNKLKTKSASFSWELMYTRSMFQTEDMIEQHNILNIVADLLDSKKLKSTHSKTLNGFTPENFKEAHKILESGKAIGKIVIKY